MLNWLRFFPLSLAQHSLEAPTEIRGPYFSKPRVNKQRFRDSTFHFQAPRANPVFSFSGGINTIDALNPGHTEITSSNLEAIHNPPSGSPNLWDGHLFYRNTWYFVGPWFSGMKERLTARGILVSCRKNSPFTNTSFFHPRSFESGVASYLDNIYGYQCSGKKPFYRGPLNWKIIPLSESVCSICCDIHFIANRGKENPGLLRTVFFPISSQEFVLFYFDFGDAPIYRDQVRAKPLLKLCDSIIKSMRLEVGPATQAEWDKVKATCPDMSLTDTFGELPWPLYKEKANKKDNELEFFVVQRPNAHHQLAVIYHRPPAHTNPLLAHQVGAEPLR